ncbi:hypothetical protein L7F22_051932 [Adiantum nelumboides]|nr:hypothetical protein [Adiantum nelumboides]
MEVQNPCPPGGPFVSGSSGDGAFKEDDRFQWLRRRVCAGLDIPELLFTSFLLDNQTLLLDFLENPSASWLILYTAVSSTHQTPRLSLSSQNAAGDTSAPIVTFASESLELHAYTGPNPRDLGRIAEHMMYFIKLKTSGLPTCQDLDVFLEYGVLPAGPTLDSLEQLLLQLFLPLLSCEDILGESKFWGVKETCLMDKMGNDLLSNMQKVLSQVASAKQSLTLATKLTIPSLPPDCLDKTDVDYEFLLELETAANDWLPVIEATVQQEAQKTPIGKHPLSELDFWRDRVNTLSSLHGQLSSQRIKNIVAVLEVGSSNIELLQSLKSQYSDLNKMFLEAKDNVNFLTTLERHFKTIHKESMTKALETIPPMMNALRMVWIISRYYSDDSHMGGLMERISTQIADRVTEEVNVKALFKLPAAEAFQKMRTAKKVLDSWSETYLQVRERIEVGGRDPRWEFDRKRLFERTTYMSSICADLLTIVEVVNDFLNFLGPELKAVTGDIEGIDSVIQPPVAGSINWARCLFGKLKKTMQKFESIGSDMMNDPTAQQMNMYYCALAKQMVSFEKHWAGQWAQSVSQQATNYLKQPILSKDLEGKIYVNFHANLYSIIRETKYLDAMGFQLPETALNVTLQEEKFMLYIENIQSMLHQYQKTTGILTSVEAKLLAYHLTTLQQVLEPGFSYLNWNSLGIPDFVSFCSKAINEFKSLVNQVQNNASSIEKAVEGIGNTNLVQETLFWICSINLVPLSWQELYERLEQERQSAVSEALKQYRSVSPLLMKLEEIVVSTNTGKSPVLVEYYKHWEQKIFDALIQMVLKGLLVLQSFFQSKKNSIRQQLPCKCRRFKVNFYLNKPDVLAQPPLNDVAGLLNRLVRTVVTSARAFIRWMDGTCMETPEQRLGGDSEPFIFNFYAEVSANPQKPESLEELKLVLNVVAEIQSSGMDIELEYLDLEERSRTRVLYGITNKPEDTSQIFDIRKRWHGLEEEAKVLSFSLQETKKKFTEITKSQVVEFSREVSSFRDRTMQKGPGKCNDLDLGLQLLEECKAELEKFQSKREQLVLAQKLFDLPVAPFPMLVEVENGLKNSVQIYDVYSEFKALVEKFSKTLWVELDIQKLVTVTEEFLIRLKRMRSLKSELIYINLEATVKSFQESLPLIQDSCG